jgi:hypothetical protein
MLFVAFTENLVHFDNTADGLGVIAGVIHPYPTQAEVIKRAADAWRRRRLTPGAKRLVGGWLRLSRLWG